MNTNAYTDVVVDMHTYMEINRDTMTNTEKTKDTARERDMKADMDTEVDTLEALGSDEDIEKYGEELVTSHLMKFEEDTRT